MAKDSPIGWTRHTFNPWWGCAKVSAECTRCYAEAFAKRTGHAVWGVDAARRFFGDAHWAEPLKWNQKAADLGECHRVFCASMADVGEDRHDLDESRARLWDLIEATPHLDWLLLTKRPENMVAIAPERWADGWPVNVWAGTTVGHVDSMPRLEALARIPAPIHFVSCEPILTALDLTDALAADPRLRWVIAGAESGPRPRPFDVDWFRSLRDQCADAGAAYFLKQFATAAGRKIEAPELDGRQWQEFPRRARDKSIEALQ